MTWSPLRISFPSHADHRLALGLQAAAALVAALLGLVFLFLLHESWPVLRDVGFTRFWTDPGWHPTEEQYSLAPMLWATLASSVGALLLATPLGIASALFCRFYATALVARAYRRVVYLLAGIPSVVFGFWGLTVLVPLIARWQPPGASLLAGILILCLMVLPTVTMTSEAALAAMPQSYVHGAAALGLSRKRLILGVALPAARHVIFSGVPLAAAQALGETMAVLMVAGNIVQTPGSPFNPVRTLTANIALEMAYAVRDHRAALFVSGLVLAALVILLALAAAGLNGGPRRA